MVNTLIYATTLTWLSSPIFCFIYILFYLPSWPLQSIFNTRARINISKCKSVSVTSLLSYSHDSTCYLEKIQSTCCGLLGPIWPLLRSWSFAYPPHCPSQLALSQTCQACSYLKVITLVVSSVWNVLSQLLHMLLFGRLQGLEMFYTCFPTFL